MHDRKRALIGAAGGLALAVALGSAAWAQTPPGGDTSATPVGGGQAPPTPDDSTQSNDPTGAAATTADTSAAATGDELVVTGIRASLRNAIQAKQAAPNIVEALSSDDIGKLPDVSIGEALARLPGLSTNRDRGNATSISIRGMGPDLVDTLLNGREVASAEASRNVRYEQFPAELITGAYVYKSPTSAQVEGAIAGQVDLKTVRPLDYKNSQLVTNIRGVYYDLGDDIDASHTAGVVGSVSYVGQFLDNRLGVALGYSGRTEPVATVRTNIFRYANAYQDLNGNGTYNDNVAYGFEGLVRGGNDTRHGAIADIQFKATDRLEINGDFFYSHLKYREDQSGFRVENFPYGNSFSNATTVGDNATAVTGQNYAYYGLQIENVNELYTFTDDLYSGGLNAVYRGDNWKLSGDFGYSKTTRNALFASITTAPNLGTGDFLTTGLGARYESNAGGVPNLQVLNNDLTTPFDLTDPTKNYFYDLEVPTNGGGAPIIHDQIYSGKMDFEYDLNGGFLQSIQTGVRFTSRDKDYTQRTYYYYPTPFQISSDYILSPVQFPGEYSGLPNTMRLDIDKLIASVGGVHPTTSTTDLGASWDVKENTQAGYVQANFAAPLLGRDLTGNVGARVVHTGYTSSSYSVNGEVSPAIATPFSVKNDFTDVLPNLNLTWHVSDGQQIRFAASRAIARAPLDSLNAGYAVYTGGSGGPSASGGNPNLKPYRADQLDLTYERYFSKDTAVTVSLFYKKLDSFIVSQVTTFTLDGQDGTFVQPVNGSGGNIKGVEVLYQQSFSFLPGLLSGFGIYANGSYTDSSISVTEQDNAIGAISLPGLSKWVFNVVPYYAKNGVEARLAYRYRSSYATELGDTDRILYTAPEGVLDAEISYEFPDSSAMKGLRLQVQANNLTDEPFETYYGDRQLQGRYEKFGRRIWFGATYKF